MRNFRQNALLTILSCAAASSAQVSDPLTANELAQSAVDHFQAAVQEAPHYAFVQDFENCTSHGRGRRICSQTHSENVIVDGIQYVLNSTNNGKKQSGSNIDVGNERFKQWCTDNPVLKTDIVARVDHLPTALATRFGNKIVGHEQVDGIDCILLESMPLPTLTDPAAQQRIQLWIDSSTHNVLRYSFSALVDPGVPTDHADGATTYFQIVNGVPLKAKVVGSIWGGSGPLEYITTYTHYQRFMGSMKIVPMAPRS